VNAMQALLLWGMLLVPMAAGGACLLIPSARRVLDVAAAGVIASSALCAGAAAFVFARGPIFSAGGWLFLDALSAYHMLVMALVFSLSGLYARGYFAHELDAGELAPAQARQFGALFCTSLASMVLVLVSNNLGVMWIGIEATTLLTAFLICVHVTPTSLEAMWKYLLVCSVGVAFAFLGTLLTGASAHRLHLSTSDALLWTRLRAEASVLDPLSIKAAFIFVLVGYGTKAGLAPMHTWLPDAHSQAPAPVSAIFSGFMLNAALYCVLRYLPLVEGATGSPSFCLDLLAAFGLVSIVVSAAFIVFQHDVKRLLAYHSVEHLGIVTLGFGLGGVGTFAALFHTLNHSVCKTLAFFCAGRLGQRHGTHDMEALSGTLRTAPPWGGALFGSLLALIGVAPFALFMSELQILRAAVDGRSFWTLGIFLAGGTIIFLGALRHAVAMAWGEPHAAPAPDHPGALDRFLAWGPLALLLVLGVWMPPPLGDALRQAAMVLGGGP